MGVLCNRGRGGRGGWGGGRAHLLLALSHLTIERASLLRRSTVLHPYRHSVIWVIFLFFSFNIICLCLSYPLPVWPSVSTTYLLGRGWGGEVSGNTYPWGFFVTGGRESGTYFTVGVRLFFACCSLYVCLHEVPYC